MSSLSVLSLTESLTNALRARIIQGELGPGDGLAEAGLAGQYNVARPTAKAAIERLVSEGLLERAAHKSARVPIMDLARIQDMYFARKLVECEAYRLLAERRSIPQAAVRSIESLRSAADSGAVADLVDSDVRFHRALIDELKSPRITKVHGMLINEMRLCLVQVQSQKLLDPETIADEHAAILDAIGAGSGDLAAEYGRAHLDRAEAQLTSHVTG
jgi:DNA-binding GntR family transcriptional regulator